MSDSDKTTEALKSAWRAGTERHAGGRACPSDEAIFDAVQCHAPASERRRIVEHISRCGACAQSWRAALELQRATPDVIDAVDWKRPAHRQPLNWGLAAAAVVCAAIGIVLMLPQIDTGVPRPGDISTLRGGEQAAFELKVPEGARLPAEAMALTWEPVEGASVYRARVMDSDLATIHYDSVETPGLNVPADALAGLSGGEILYWYVIATMEDGSELRSETGTITLDRTGS